MKKIAYAFAPMLLLITTPFLSSAHPGHGETDGYSIIHYFVEPMHAVVTFGALAAALAYIRYSRKKKA